jgi:hypothetical protein
MHKQPVHGMLARQRGLGLHEKFWVPAEEVISIDKTMISRIMITSNPVDSRNV